MTQLKVPSFSPSVLAKHDKDNSIDIVEACTAYDNMGSGFVKHASK